MNLKKIFLYLAILLSLCCIEARGDTNITSASLDEQEARDLDEDAQKKVDGGVSAVRDALGNVDNSSSPDAPPIKQAASTITHDVVASVDTGAPTDTKKPPLLFSLGDNSCIPVDDDMYTSMGMASRGGVNNDTLSLWVEYDLLFFMNQSLLPGVVSIPGYNNFCDIGGDEQINYCFGQYVIGEDGTKSIQHQCVAQKDGEEKIFLNPPAKIKAAYSSGGTQMCVTLYTPIGYKQIGCKSITNPYGSSANTATFTDCVSIALDHSQVSAPITGLMIQCIYSTLDTVFYDTITFRSVDTAGLGTMISLFPEFQQRMRGVVQLILLLYVMIMGLKLSNGMVQASGSELIMFILKFALVLYFSVGIKTNYTAEGSPIYGDGVTQLLKPAFQSLSTSLTRIMLGAGDIQGSDKSTQANKLCYFDPKSYDARYSYFSLWDSLDCRFYQYFALGGKGGVIGGAAFMILGGVLNPLTWGTSIISLVFLALFLLYILMFFILMVFFVVFFSFCYVCLSIVLYFAPLFVPMVLFEYTKGYYQSWLKTCLSFALQPMIVVTFISFVLLISDTIIFPDCQFINASVVDSSLGAASSRSYTDFELAPALSSTCANSLGGILLDVARNGSSGSLETFNTLFFDFRGLKTSVMMKLFSSLILIVLFFVLMQRFFASVADLAADITSGPRLSGFMDAVMAMMKSIAVSVAAAVVPNNGAKDDKKDDKKEEEGGASRGGGPSGGGGASKVSSGGDKGASKVSSGGDKGASKVSGGP